MYVDFLGLVMDQLANQAAKIRYDVRRPDRRPDGAAHAGRHRAFGRRAAFAEPGRRGSMHIARPAPGDAGHRGGRVSPAAPQPDPARPGRVHRAQGAVHAARGERRFRPRPVTSPGGARRCGATGRGRHASSPIRAWCISRWRQPRRWRKAGIEADGDRPAHAEPAGHGHGRSPRSSRTGRAVVVSEAHADRGSFAAETGRAHRRGMF